MAAQHTKYRFKAIRYFKTTTHYCLISEHFKNQISDKINISENRGFANSKPVFWCQERKNNKWITPRLTGLFPTFKKDVYWGCRGRYNDLILFVFKNNGELMIIYYFENYFTRNLKPIINNLK